MEKKYEFPDENEQAGKLGEPEIEYYRTTNKSFSPSPTEEELRDSMNSKEFVAYWCKCIDEIFDK